VFVLVVPAVVIPDKTLWVVDYHQGETLMEQRKPQQAEQASFYISKDYGSADDPYKPQYSVSHLEFFTLTGFRKFVGNITLGSWLSLVLFPQDKLREEHSAH
jgi:hypothetical protein